MTKDLKVFLIVLLSVILFGMVYSSLKAQQLAYELDVIVFNDTDNNGIEGSEEYGIGGILVRVETLQTGTVYTRTTDNNGFAIFRPLPAQYDYKVTVQGGVRSYTVNYANNGAGGYVIVNYPLPPTVFYLPLVHR